MQMFRVEKLLFNHLAYAAMRCSDQGYISLDQLFLPIELGVQASVQQVASTKRRLWYSGGQRGMRLLHQSVSSWLTGFKIVVSSLKEGRHSWAARHQLPI
jgi:hypothetical protein